MSTSNMASERKVRFAAALVAIGCGLTSAACGVQPGDYRVYRVAGGSTTQSVGCYYPLTEIPSENIEDSNSIFTSQTFTVHQGADGQVYLNSAGLALGGEETSDGFVFTGEQVDVEYVGMDDDARLVVNTVITATMNVDGGAIEGTIESVGNTSCTYVTATPSDTTLCPSPPPPSCVSTTAFVGVELDDVELTTDID